MKKFLSSILIFILLITLLGVNVYAGNGPLPKEDMGDGSYYDPAYISFYDAKEYGVKKAVYSESTVRNEMAGATYDKASNTLTLTNLNTDMLLEINAMGDNFSIKLVGNNTIGRIIVWGWGWGGTLTFSGNGTLTVNPNKIYDNAIVLESETAASALKVGKDVTLKLYAKNDVAVIRETSINTTANAIVFANGQTANITREIYSYTSTVWISGFHVEDKVSIGKIANENDPTGIYGYQEDYKFDYNTNEYIEGYYIYKFEYNDEYNAYISITKGEYDFIPKTDLALSGYTIVPDEDYGDCYYYLDSYIDLYEDNNKKQYAVNGYWDSNDEYIYQIYDMKKVHTDPDLYMLIENNIMEISSLTPVRQTTQEPGFYTYILKGTNFSYTPGVKISSVKLAKTSYTYDGKTKKPKVTAKDNKGNTLKEGTDYTVSYPSGRKKVGTYTVKVTFKGKYTGSKKLTFTIKPKGTKLSNLTAGSKKITATWKAQKTQTTGYELQYSTNSKFKSGNKTKTIKSNKTTSKTVKKLKGKKKYYVRIRTYKTVSGKKIYSSWSKSKYVTTKK